VTRSGLVDWFVGAVDALSHVLRVPTRYRAWLCNAHDRRIGVFD
jgi:hypothetical protein